MIRFCLRLALTLPICTAVAGADPAPCPDTRFLVEAATTGLQDQLCRDASHLSATLAACGLVQSRPLLIQIVQDIEHPVAECLAAYDCDFGRIRILDPAHFATAIPETSPYAALPPDVLIRSLLAHELSHALLDQGALNHEIALVDHEYVAAAMELDQMPDEWREVMLAESMLSEARDGLVNIWIYRLEPRRFAANAWLHFQSPGHGCTLVRDIAEGRQSLARDD